MSVRVLSPKYDNCCSFRILALQSSGDSQALFLLQLRSDRSITIVVVDSLLW